MNKAQEYKWEGVKLSQNKTTMPIYPNIPRSSHLKMMLGKKDG